MNMQQPNQNQQQQKKAKLKIEEYVEFDGTYEGKVTTTIDFARSVNSLFRPVLSDYEGSSINVINGQMYMELYFKEKGAPSPEQKKCIQQIVQPSKDRDIIARVTNLSKMNSTNQKLELTEDAKDILEGFMIKTSNGKVNWKECVYETIDRNYGNQSSITLCLRGLDIYQLLKSIYGTKDPVTKHIYQYQITVNRPINQMDYVITISRVDSNIIEELCIRLNMTPATGSSLIMVRD